MPKLFTMLEDSTRVIAKQRLVELLLPTIHKVEASVHLKLTMGKLITIRLVGPIKGQIQQHLHQHNQTQQLIRLDNLHNHLQLRVGRQ